MFAVTVVGFDRERPLNGLTVGDHPESVVPRGWTTVRVKAAALNHHDLWVLRGKGMLPEQLPRVLGSDAAGIDGDGNEVIVHSVIGNPFAGGGDETRDPNRRLLSESCDGTFADLVAVPTANLVPKPAALSFAEAACLPGAWLTAYRMLFQHAEAPPGSTVLVQGATGGVASALIALGAAAGIRVWATSRTETGRRWAVESGADRAFTPGERLPERVDAVMETVGRATWAHSIRAVRSGGRIVVCGTTTGAPDGLDLDHVFYRQISIIGCTLGTRDQLTRLTNLCVTTGVRPAIHRILPLAQARQGFAELAEGRVKGKVVFAIR